jgi:hypothetical protein
MWYAPLNPLFLYYYSKGGGASAAASFIIPTGSEGANEYGEEQDGGLMLSDAEKADILRMHGTPHLYNKLVESICPR